MFHESKGRITQLDEKVRSDEAKPNGTSAIPLEIWAGSFRHRFCDYFACTDGSINWRSFKFNAPTRERAESLL
jgi:hypothetical protein